MGNNFIIFMIWCAVTVYCFSGTAIAMSVPTLDQRLPRLGTYSNLQKYIYSTYISVCVLCNKFYPDTRRAPLVKATTRIAFI